MSDHSLTLTTKPYRLAYFDLSEYENDQVCDSFSTANDITEGSLANQVLWQSGINYPVTCAFTPITHTGCTGTWLYSLDKSSMSSILTTEDEMILLRDTNSL